MNVRAATRTGLARLLRADRSTMLAVTSSPAQRGLIERRPAPDPGRRLGLHLTPAGAAPLGSVREAVLRREA